MKKWYIFARMRWEDGKNFTPVMELLTDVTPTMDVDHDRGNVIIGPFGYIESDQIDQSNLVQTEKILDMVNSQLKHIKGFTSLSFSNDHLMEEFEHNKKDISHMYDYYLLNSQK
jgi:hypothetical protein